MIASASIGRAAELRGRGFGAIVGNDGAVELRTPQGTLLYAVDGWFLETSAGLIEHSVAPDIAGPLGNPPTISIHDDSQSDMDVTLRLRLSARGDALYADMVVTHADTLTLLRGGLHVRPSAEARVLLGPRAITSGDTTHNQPQTLYTERVCLSQGPWPEPALLVRGRHEGAGGVEWLSANEILFYDGQVHETRLRRPGHEDLRAWSGTTRGRGDRDSMTIELQVGRDGPCVFLDTYPAGRQAAFTIVDDADGERGDLLLAAYYGCSDTTDASFGTRGICGNGLRTTRTVFASSRLDDVWRRLSRSGVEIALHTPSGGPDSARVIRETLADMGARYGVRHWVDHSDNPENIGFRGSCREPGNPFYALDVLEESGIDYVWVEPNLFFGFDAFRDRRELPHTLDQLDDPTQPAQVLVYGRTGGVFFENYYRSFKELVTPQALDDLQQRGGLAILYTHTCVQWYRGVEVGFLQETPGGWVIKEEADALFGLLAERLRSGDLWVAPATEVFDRLVGMQHIDLEPVGGEDGAWWLSNHNPAPMDSIGLRVPGATAILVDGVSQRIADDGLATIARLEVDGRVLLETVPATAGDMPRLARVTCSPNPFSRYVVIAWPAGCPPAREVSIWDAAGRSVWRCPQSVFDAGWSWVLWDGRDDLGRPAPAGRYWMTAGPRGVSPSLPILLIR